VKDAGRIGRRPMLPAVSLRRQSSTGKEKGGLLAGCETETVEDGRAESETIAPKSAVQHLGPRRRRRSVIGPDRDATVPHDPQTAPTGRKIG
jgi:hypothetical protein